MKTPFLDHLGIRLARGSEQGVQGRLTIAEPHFNSSGVVHGGVLFSLADTVMGYAVHQALPPEQRCATIDARISYFKPVTAGEILCEAVLVSKGRSIAHVEATLSNEGTTVATAQATFAIRARGAQAAD